MSIDINTVNSLEEAQSLIAEEEAKQQAAFTEIGRLYYTSKGAESEELKNLVAEMDASVAEIEAIKQRMEELKNPENKKNACPECGSPVKEDSLFCTACGARLSKDSPEPEPVTPSAPANNAPICPRCGSEMKSYMRFCTVCGSPLSAPKEEPELPKPPTMVYEAAPVPEIVVPGPFPEPMPEADAEPDPESEPETVIEKEPEPAPAKVTYSTPEPSYICRNCGMVSAPGTRFCINCGTNLQEASGFAGAPAPKPAPKQVNPFEKPHTPAPKQDYGVRRCQSCGHITADPTMLFCTECGTRLS